MEQREGIRQNFEVLFYLVQNFGEGNSAKPVVTCGHTASWAEEDLCLAPSGDIIKAVILPLPNRKYKSSNRKLFWTYMKKAQYCSYCYKGYLVNDNEIDRMTTDTLEEPTIDLEKAKL